jgi:hypothetical protein
MSRLKIFATLLFLLVGTGIILGQQSGQSSPPKPAYFYNVDTERRVEGVIRKVVFEARYEDRAPFLVVILEEKSTGQLYKVEISPAWFFEHDLHQGEHIKIIGSFYAKEDEYFLIARELQVRGETFRLRDRRGFPNWRGGPTKGKIQRRGRGI